MNRLPQYLVERLASATASIECELGLSSDLPTLVPSEAGFQCEMSASSSIRISPTAKVSSGSTIKISGKNNVIVIAAEADLANLKIEVSGSDNILAIGPRVYMRGGVTLKVVGERSHTTFGRASTWVGGSSLCEGSDVDIIVGDDCMFASGVVLRTNDGHSVFDKETLARLNPPASVKVDAHVWLANGVRVSKGARIGSGSVIAQASIVSGYVEKNCIYGGVPARKLRSDIIWSRTESIDDVPERFR